MPNELFEHFSSTNLEGVNQIASLQRRYDSKYIIHESRLIHLVAELQQSWLVLSLKEQQSFLYRTTYFDDHNLTSYRDHLKGRRTRHKIRIRTYSDDSSFLEVKQKTGRGETNKFRRPRSAGHQDQITPQEHDWLDQLITGVDRHSLHATLHLNYLRSTLVNPEMGERLTIDQQMVVSGHEDLPLIAGATIIELKNQFSHSPTSRLLVRCGARRLSVSKYCAGIARLNPDFYQGMIRSAQHLVRLEAD
jgi:hypothetical protein